MAKTKSKHGFYRPKEVAEMLGVCNETVWRYIRSDRLKVIKLTERNFRISKQELNKFLNKRK